MHDGKLIPSDTPLPLPADPEQVALGFEQLEERLARDENGLMRELVGEPDCRALLEAVFGGSPFLTQQILKDPAFFADVVREGPESSLAAVLGRLDGLHAEDEKSVVRELRIARRRVALATALADITGAWPVLTVTEALSRFADMAISVALARQLRTLAATGAIELANEDEPLQDSGLFVLGMGKLGGDELNYSSDIDLIVLYDPASVRTDSPDRLSERFVRLTQNTIAMLQDRDAEGYVFRVDLRLRPDPGATPLAMSVGAAETYYESMGQNWERAAMIKARPAAGDMAAAEDFLGHLRPFVWRRNLDFAAIQDIHSIKRQVNAHKGGARIAVLGHDVKLGRGGIREIELFAQTQQLIYGGRELELRVRPTCDALRALTAVDRVTSKTAGELIESYEFLRRLEHRLQMVHDQQTHRLPDSDAALESFSRFMGYAAVGEFRQDLLGHFHRVEEHYADLFEEAPTLSGPGNLVFTGGEHDPETLATLERAGFREAERVSSMVRQWHHGRYRATRSTRSRELLTELMPALVDAFAKTANPDAAFLKFDEFLRGLPAGVQLFSLFHSNPELLQLVADVMGGAPRLAAHLSRQPNLFDAVLSGDFFEPMPEPDELAAELAQMLTQARDFQDLLDYTRRWTNDRKFQAGIQQLRGVINARTADRWLSNIADAAIRGLIPAIEAEFAERHGTIENGGLVVIAMGKYGGQELSATSDLDLAFVYDAPDGATSNGERELAKSTYYARLAQRIVSALTAPTAEGQLFEVDTRLRPSGKDGPVAGQISAYRDYYRERAWTWEHMALTRARVVAGPTELAGKMDTAIREILRRPRETGKLAIEVAEMRERMAEQHGPAGAWQIKHIRGGLIDAEFIAQFLQLKHAATHDKILSANTAQALRNLGNAGIIDPARAKGLVDAAELWQSVQSMLRLTVEDRFVEEEATPALKTELAKCAGTESFDALLRRMEEAAALVRDAYAEIVAEPAQQARDTQTENVEENTE